MEVLRTFLEAQPLLSMFVVIGLGYALGGVNIRGFALGAGAVLFVGLGVGMFAPKAAPPPSLVDGILPGLEGLDAGLPPAARLAQAVEMNVRRTVRTILDSPEGRARQAEGRVKCVGAIYEIETGCVRFLHPAIRQAPIPAEAGMNQAL